MRKGRVSEEQIVVKQKKHQAGISAKQLCRKHGASVAT
jgi:putative transposase